MLNQKTVFSPSNHSKECVNLSNQSNTYPQLDMEKLRQHSLSDVIRLASQANMRHDANGCDQCHVVAEYYTTAIRYARESEPIQCNDELFDLVWRMTNLVLAHRETNKYQFLGWFDMVTAELWDFAKQLKDESWDRDNYINSTTSLQFLSDSEDEEASEEENYRRAMRITIYNCRALVCEQYNQKSQAVIYYKKCASVRSTPFEHQQYLQQSALTAIQRLADTNRPLPPSKIRSYSGFSGFSSDASSTSTSGSNTSFSACSNCGLEKMNMPVCAKCKTQPYCSVRCMKSHKSIHESICSSKV